MASRYKQQIVEYLKSRQYKADQILDVGGGEKKASDYTTVEFNRYLTLDNNLDTRPNFIHDLNEFKHPEELFTIERNPHFDLIFCLNVFEYIHNPYNAVSNLYTWLAPGGKLVITFPFLYSLHEPKGIDYLRYTHEWVQKMFHEKFQFSQVETTVLQATDGAAALNEFYSKEKIHTRKGDDSWLEIGTILEAVK